MSSFAPLRTTCRKRTRVSHAARWAQRHGYTCVGEQPGPRRRGLEQLAICDGVSGASLNEPGSPASPGPRAWSVSGRGRCGRQHSHVDQERPANLIENLVPEQVHRNERRREQRAAQFFKENLARCWMSRAAVSRSTSTRASARSYPAWAIACKRGSSPFAPPRRRSRRGCTTPSRRWSPGSRRTSRPARSAATPPGHWPVGAPDTRGGAA